MHYSSWARSTWAPLPDAEYRIESNCQPLIKLHGSSNWRNGDGGPLIVIGGGKAATIRVHSVLTRNSTEFEKSLLAGGTRLMVVGYGFRDAHVNEVIMRGVSNHRLRFFLVDTDGTGLARKLNPTSGLGMMYKKTDLEEIFEIGVVRSITANLTGSFLDAC